MLKSYLHKTCFKSISIDTGTLAFYYLLKWKRKSLILPVSVSPLWKIVCAKCEGVGEWAAPFGDAHLNKTPLHLDLFGLTYQGLSEHDDHGPLVMSLSCTWHLQPPHSRCSQSVHINLMVPAAQCRASVLWLQVTHLEELTLNQHHLPKFQACEHSEIQSNTSQVSLSSAVTGFCTPASLKLKHWPLWPLCSVNKSVTFRWLEFALLEVPLFSPQRTKTCCRHLQRPEIKWPQYRVTEARNSWRRSDWAAFFPADPGGVQYDDST